MDPIPIHLAAPSTTNETLEQIIVAKNLFLASLTLIVFDHFLTIRSEVVYVWQRPKTFVLWLFLAIRYYAILALLVVAVGYFSPVISGTTCLHWSLFLPLGITMPLSIGPSILLSVRVYAMYGRSKYIAAGLGTILCAQFAAGLWQYTVKGGRVAPDPLNNYLFHYCIYLPPASLGSVSSMYVFIDLSFNTLLFGLTLGRTFFVYWRQKNVKDASSLLKTLAGNGAMYFGVIFCTNLGWALMILLAPTGLRGVFSQPTAALTTIMMSRITLNLRSTGTRRISYLPPPLTGNYTRKTTDVDYEGGHGARGGGNGGLYPLEVLTNQTHTRASRMSKSGIGSSIRFERLPPSPISPTFSMGGRSSIRSYGGGYAGYPPPPPSPGILITSHTETFADVDV